MIKISRKQTQEKENINKKCPTKWSVQQKQKVFQREQEEAVDYPVLLPTNS